jgi:hypothetical protein
MIPHSRKKSGLAAVREFALVYVRFGSKADIALGPRHVRFTPKSGHQLSAFRCPLCAKSGLMHRSKPFVIRLSSARVSSDGGS